MEFTRIEKVLGRYGKTLADLPALTKTEAAGMKNFPVVSVFGDGETPKPEILAELSAAKPELPADWREQLEAEGYRFETVVERVEGGKWIFEAACKTEYRSTGARSYTHNKWLSSSKVGFGNYHTADDFPWIKLAEDQLKGQFVRYEDEDSFQVALWSGQI